MGFGICNSEVHIVGFVIRQQINHICFYSLKLLPFIKIIYGFYKHDKKPKKIFICGYMKMAYLYTKELKNICTFITPKESIRTLTIKTPIVLYNQRNKAY
jgi:hypothetical protein